ncbi:MAG: hypothetical protein ABIP48_09905 [Planctomycetota bacterium]
MSGEKLPSEEHFRTLSRRGLVAFAARCLRRVQTLPGYQEAHQDIAQIIQALWQFPRDLFDEPNTAAHRAEIELHWNQVGSPLVVIACETALQALGEAGASAPRWAHGVAVATDKATLAWGHDISDFLRSDVEALCRLVPGPFPEMGEPLDETGLELASPLWPNGGKPPWSQQA